MSDGQQIRLWDDNQRALPRAFARSALFRAANKEARRRISGEIAAADGIRIEYVGDELRTDDEEILMLILHQLRGRDVGDPEQLYVEMTRHEALRALERPTDGRYYAELSGSLDRMALGGLKVTYRSPSGKRYKITQSIIRKVAYADEAPESGRIRIWLEPEVLQFFLGGSGSEDETFLVAWRERVSLRRPLAKWLHSHLHALGLGSRGHVVCSLSMIWKLSGSEASTVKSFRVILQRALEDMLAASVIGTWSMRRDLLCVTPRGHNGQICWNAAELNRPTITYQATDAADTASGDLDEQGPNMGP
jgi:hypothetical protein